MQSFQRFSVAVLLTLPLLAGCGYKGPLDPPPDAKQNAVAQKPDPNAPKPAKPPHKPFILDGLIN